MVTVLSTTLNEDDIELGEAEEDDSDGSVAKPARSRKGKFLESEEVKIDKSNPLHLERLEHVKSQVMDHLRVTKNRKNSSRPDSKRKGSDHGEEEMSQNSSRPRTQSLQ